MRRKRTACIVGRLLAKVAKVMQVVQVVLLLAMKVEMEMEMEMAVYLERSLADGIRLPCSGVYYGGTWSHDLMRHRMKFTFIFKM